MAERSKHSLHSLFESFPVQKVFLAQRGKMFFRVTATHQKSLALLFFVEGFLLEVGLVVLFVCFKFKGGCNGLSGNRRFLGLILGMGRRASSLGLTR